MQQGRLLQAKLTLYCSICTVNGALEGKKKRPSISQDSETTIGKISTDPVVHNIYTHFRHCMCDYIDEIMPRLFNALITGNLSY